MIEGLAAGRRGHSLLASDNANRRQFVDGRDPSAEPGGRCSKEVVKMHGEDEVSEDRPSMSWLSEGIVLSQRVMVVALALSLPVLLGYGVDASLAAYRGVASLPVGLLLGCAFGMLSGGWQLWRLTQWLEKRGKEQADRIRQSRDQP